MKPNNICIIYFDDYSRCCRREILTIKADKDMFEGIQGVTKDILQLICQDWGILQTPEEISNRYYKLVTCNGLNYY